MLHRISFLLLNVANILQTPSFVMGSTTKYIYVACQSSPHGNPALARLLLVKSTILLCLLVHKLLCSAFSKTANGTTNCTSTEMNGIGGGGGGGPHWPQTRGGGGRGYGRDFQTRGRAGKIAAVQGSTRNRHFAAFGPHLVVPDAAAS